MYGSVPMVLTPFSQFEDYAFCPKKVENNLNNLSGKNHTPCLNFQEVVIRQTIHQLNTVFLENGKEVYSEERKLLLAYNIYDRGFHNPRTLQGDPLTIYWGDYSPRHVYQEGLAILELLIKDPLYSTQKIQFLEKVIILHLIPDNNRQIFIPSLHHTKDSINIPCLIHAITFNHTILDLCIGSKISDLSRSPSHMKYCLLDLAIDQHNGLPHNQSYDYLCFHVIRSRQPKLRSIHFRKAIDTRPITLKDSFCINQGITKKTFFQAFSANCHYCEFQSNCPSSTLRNRFH